MQVVSGYTEAQTELTLLNFEPYNVELSYDTEFDNVPGATITFTLNTKGGSSLDRVISLRSDLQLYIDFPDKITVPAGSNSVQFEATIADLKTAVNEQNIAIIAEGNENTSSTANVTIGPFNVPDFEFSIQSATILENEGSEALQVSVIRNTLIEKEQLFELRATGTNNLTFPSQLFFDVGETEVNFVVGIVDDRQNQGDRLADLVLAIVFDSCDCTNAGLDKANKSIELTILDDDGPALALATEAALLTNGSTTEITISRPSADTDDLSLPLTITLTSSNNEVLSVPETIQIPAGEASVSFSVQNQIASTLPQSELVQITAQAEGLSAAKIKINASNQDTPDLILEISAIEEELFASSELTINTILKNQGASIFPTGASLEFYLSDTNVYTNLAPIYATIIDQSVPAGEEIRINETVLLPNAIGEKYLIVAVNMSTLLEELSLDNNIINQPVTILPAYEIAATIDKSVYVAGESIKIAGRTVTAGGEAYPTADIQVTIAGESISRNFDLQSNASGNFEMTYVPLENESGDFTVTASFPGEKIEPQAEFNLLAINWANKSNYVKWEPVAGVPFEQTLLFKNKAAIPLTNVQIEIPEEAPFTLTQTPATVAAESELKYSITLNTDIVTLENAYTEVPITIRSNEGATFTETIYFYSRSQTATLVANPVSINTTMRTDAARVYEFELKNIGQTAAQNVAIRIPDVPWMSLRSNALIPEIDKNDSETVAISLQASNDLQLNVPITGSIVVGLENGTDLSIPFRIEPVSEKTGSLVVTATDEYTYNTPSAPNLSGAKVVVKRPYSGVVVAEGITDENGMFEIPEVEEGYYTLSIQADKHASYQNNITIDPGTTNSISAFLSYQAVTYSWNVERIELEDQYKVTLTTEFETNVPKPMVVMELDDKNLDMVIGETKTVNLTVTNYGLIAANDLKISTDRNRWI